MNGTLHLQIQMTHIPCYESEGKECIHRMEEMSAAPSTDTSLTICKRVLPVTVPLVKSKGSVVFSTADVAVLAKSMPLVVFKMPNVPSEEQAENRCKSTWIRMLNKNT